ncbi:FecR family protein [Arcicella aquatica]|uniref:FecR family protein n=1 Tax=Arcicella aquatica TaxID=217141 RepID=A0ABU5QIR1_9BACT|nr:FecR family protein [Arcicella aquatica]MEA5256690.1 FecR family protein [Arcicella aquatica]
MNYQNFEIEDFVADDYFKNWVLAPNAESEMFWNNYIEQYPEKNAVVEESRLLIMGLREAETAYFPIKKTARIWDNIQQKVQNEEDEQIIGSIFRLRIPYLRIVATLAICMGLSYWWVSHNQSSALYTALFSSTKSDTDLVEEVNLGSTTKKIYLSDGSIVSLEKNSKLRYKKGFEVSKRVVYLTGEAFFEISKNPKRPFLVYSNEVITKVLGTSFRVTAYENAKDIVVSVKTGKVSVFANKSATERDEKLEDELKGVVLKPNQQAVYERNTDRLNKTLVAIPDILVLPPVNQNFEFDNTPISEVFATLQKAYGIEIVYDEDLMKACFLTAPLGNESLFEKMRVVCKTIGARYEIIDGQVVVYSKGCE